MPDTFKVRQVVQVVRLAPGVVILASQEHLDARHEGATGTVVSVVHGQEDLIWVQHGRTTAPYFSYELSLLGEPCDDDI